MYVCLSVQQAITPFCNSIWTSDALINNEIREDGESLMAPGEGKKKGKNTESNTHEKFQVDFLLPLVSMLHDDFIF